MPKGLPRSVTWLHLSDLHLCEPRTGWDAARVIRTLTADLADMRRQYRLRPDLIFFTGDLAFGEIPNFGLDRQFADGARFLDAVRRVFPDLDRSRVFIVPGNHDVDRTRVSAADTFWLDSLKGDEGLRTVSECLKTCNVEWRGFMDRLAPYARFLGEHGYRHLLQDPARLIYAKTVKIDGLRLGIGGVNSSWSCCREEEAAKLWMGRWQLEELNSRMQDVDIRILLSHHPLSWFRREEDPQLRRQIQRDFHFHLHGHEHQEWVDLLPSHVCIAAGACYEGSDRRNVYNFVQLDPAAGEGRVFFRMYDGTGWVPRVISGRTDVHGRLTLDLPWLNPDLAAKLQLGGKRLRAKYLQKLLIPLEDVEIVEEEVFEDTGDTGLEISAIPDWVPLKKQPRVKRKTK